MLINPILLFENTNVHHVKHIKPESWVNYYVNVAVGAEYVILDKDHLV